MKYDKIQKRSNFSPFWLAPASLVHDYEINKTKIISSDQLKKEVCKGAFACACNKLF